MVEAAGSKCSEEQLGREDFTKVTAAASNDKKDGRALYLPKKKILEMILPPP